MSQHCVRQEPLFPQPTVTPYSLHNPRVVFLMLLSNKLSIVHKVLRINQLIEQLYLDRPLEWPDQEIVVLP